MMPEVWIEDEPKATNKLEAEKNASWYVATYKLAGNMLDSLVGPFFCYFEMHYARKLVIFCKLSLTLQRPLHAATVNFPPL